MIFPRNVVMEQYSADGNLLIETMIAENEVASKTTEPVYQEC